MIGALKSIYHKVFPPYEYELEKAIGDCKTLLDLGCGYPSPIRAFSKKYFSVGVDLFEPDIEKSKKEGIHNKYVELGVMEIGRHFKEDSFECVLASDLLEHLDKEDGERLITTMENIASKKVVIFTPNGFVSQPGYGGNPWQEHKSGWTSEEMGSKGYRVVGINGLRSLRKEFAQLRLSPKVIWQPISDITQLIVKHAPRLAYAILCVKDL